ncbi:MAG: hypothetical protein ACH34U_14045 [Cyanobium sp.]
MRIAISRSAVNVKSLGLHRSTLYYNYYKPIPVRESDAADE